jgi:hypothetical protein
MVPLIFQEVFDPRFPDFPVTRVQASVHFEPALPDMRVVTTYFEGALIDTGAGYLTIPQKLHRLSRLKIYQELGKKPFRILSDVGDPHLQRFAEVGLRFLIKQSNGSYAYWPKEFVKVKAFLLDEDTRPKTKVLIGLDALLEHFVTHVEKGNSYLKARGS